jgi:pimeloyl-ACP methyl ester carboxylesterase
MRLVWRALSLCAGVLLAAGGVAGAQPCSAPDNVTRVSGGGECLVIRTFGAPPARGAPVLAVVIHGDVSSGGPARYHFALAEQIGGAGTIAVGLIRPGYEDGAGGQSTGSNFNRVDSYTAHNIDAVAAAVRMLRAYHKARRVVLVGHSGGAAISAVILGKHPGTADAAVLVACPCNIANWRSGGRAWPRSESPHAYAGAVPAVTQVVALTGTRDDNTFPALASAYVQSLAARGVRARFAELPGADHNAAFRAPETLRAAREALAGR